MCVKPTYDRIWCWLQKGHKLFKRFYFSNFGEFPFIGVSVHCHAPMRHICSQSFWLIHFLIWSTAITNSNRISCTLFGTRHFSRESTNQRQCTIDLNERNGADVGRCIPSVANERRACISRRHNISNSNWTADGNSRYWSFNIDAHLVWQWNHTILQCRC